jgi:hypothetical protein
VNPYLVTSFAMCGILALSLGGTAYLAVYFNRRAKRDLEEKLQPLAEAIHGSVNLDRALVEGKHGGDLVFGRVETGAGGIGRVFHVDRLDAAGGVRWEWSSLPDRKDPLTSAVAFESDDPSLADRLGLDWPSLAGVVADASRTRFGFLYDPAAGHVRLTRAMGSRNDIPDAERFIVQVDALGTIARANRRVQQGTTASSEAAGWTMGPGHDGSAADRDHQ